jgi:hypothetical protein
MLNPDFCFPIRARLRPRALSCLLTHFKSLGGKIPVYLAFEGPSAVAVVQAAGVSSGPQNCQKLCFKITEIAACLMGKETVAEFVGSPAISGLLREICVHYAQGYAVGCRCRWMRCWSPADL